MCNAELQHPSVKCLLDSKTLRIISSAAEGLREETITHECRATLLSIIPNTQRGESVSLPSQRCVKVNNLHYHFIEADTLTNVAT